MHHTTTFLLDGIPVTVRFPDSGWSPTTTLLQYLRSMPGHRGVKEGCAEGDCGACTVVLADIGADGRLLYRSVDSCLVFLPMLHGRQVITVENLAGPDGTLHPVQEAMVGLHGSQCGYCTPGIAMSLLALYKNCPAPDRSTIEDHLHGNLCRCTGYEPIVAAAMAACVHGGVDHFTDAEARTMEALRAIPRASLDLAGGGCRYLRPATLEEALTLRARHPNALVISGATDVALRVTKHHETLPEILDISGIDAVRTITREDDALVVGAGAPISQVRAAVARDFPALRSMLDVFGSMQIRNMASLGGNLGTASPIGDALPVLMALDASVRLTSVLGAREIPLRQFITGYRKTKCRPDELITAIRIPWITDGSVVRSYKVSKRRHLDISSVSAGFRLRLDADGCVADIVLAYGGMAETTRRATVVERALRGRPWRRDVVEAAMPLLEAAFTPITDARSGARLRSIVARNLLMKLFLDTTDGFAAANPEGEP